VAYIRKQRGKWRAEVQRNGVRVSAVFEAKAAATAWAAREETAIMAVKHGAFPRRTLAEAIDRYVRDVSALKAGARFEELRLEALKRDFPALARKQLSTITTSDIAEWRDARLAVVTKGAVQRDINLLSHVFSKARDEWKWTGETPFKGLQAPGDNPPRDRLPTGGEVRRLLRWLGHQTGRLPQTKLEETGFAFLLSLRTAMRAGEVLQLGPATVRGSVALVRHKMQYKTGKPRRVPLSRRAVALLRGFPGFTIDSRSLDTLFRKARDSLLIEDLHFHDARAAALTRFSRKVDVLELARISGHKDLRVLMEHYYRTSSEDIASRMG
jgi:integrase